jgi:hypothetical protein
MSFQKVVTSESPTTRTTDRPFFSICAMLSAYYVSLSPRLRDGYDIRVRICRWRCSSRENDLPQWAYFSVFGIFKIEKTNAM